MYTKEIEYMIYYFEFDVERTIGQVICGEQKAKKNLAIECNNKIVTLIKVKEGYREKYKSVKEYLQETYCDDDVEKVIESIEKEKEYYEGEIYTLEDKEENNGIEQNEREIEKVIDWFILNIKRFIKEILEDNQEEPEYSAVTCNNKIIALIKTKEGYKEKYKTVEEYLQDIGCTKKQIKIFVERREKEKEYYIGEIFEL